MTHEMDTGVDPTRPRSILANSRGGVRRTAGVPRSLAQYWGWSGGDDWIALALERLPRRELGGGTGSRTNAVATAGVRECRRGLRRGAPACDLEARAPRGIGDGCAHGPGLGVADSAWPVQMSEPGTGTAWQSIDTACART